MIGKVLARVREDRQITKTELAKRTKIDIGHLTHIEKEERNPSHGALRTLCDAMDVPYEPLMHTYDIELSEDQKRYAPENHIKYDVLPVFDAIIGFEKCPEEVRAASFVLRIHDTAMAPKINNGQDVYVQYNCPLANKDVGIFEFNGKLLIRKFIIRKTDLVLRAEDESIPDIVVTKDDTFNIIGKVLGVVKSPLFKA